MAIEQGSDLLKTVVLLGAGVLAVPLFKRLGLGSVLGYLAAGLAVGPFGLAVFSESQTILHVAELGVVMFLFVIGLDTQPSRLWKLRRQIFGLGLMQVLTRVHVEKFMPFGGIPAAFDPIANIRVGSAILKEYLKREGSVEGALKSYDCFRRSLMVTPDTTRSMSPLFSDAKMPTNGVFTIRTLKPAFCATRAEARLSGERLQHRRWMGRLRKR